jgi:hypothetical protein
MSNETDPVTLEHFPVSRGVLLNTKMYNAKGLVQGLQAGVRFVPHTRRPFTNENIRRIMAKAGPFNPSSMKITLQNINRVLRNGTLARSYNSIHNVNKSYFKTAFDAWASQSKISPRTARALYDAIQVKSKMDFSTAVDDIVRALGSQSFMKKRKKFAMIVDLDTAPGNAALFTPGSSLLLAGAVIRGLQRMPDVVVTVRDGSVVNKRQFQRAMREGIRNFVYVDDAAFTGEQKSHVVRELQSMFVEYATSEKFMSSFNLWLSIAFATPRARARIAKSVTIRWHDDAILSEFLKETRLNFTGLILHRHVAQELGPVRLPAAARIELWHRLRKENRRSGPSMTILAHKVPNRWSFGAGLARALESSMPSGAWAAANRRV